MAEGKDIVVRIREVLDSRVKDVTPELRDMAERYAALCRETNTRLRQCADYLKQGMRTEAVHLAETPPPVLELAGTLAFHGSEKWREFCSKAGLAIPASIAGEIVARLNGAYTQEESLSPLLTEYRRAVRRGTYRQTIRLLRRLAELDPENPNWRTDLGGFERERKGELAEEVSAAASGADGRKMESLLNELQDPAWQEAPDPELAEMLTVRLAELKDMKALARAEGIAAEVSAAYGALDAARVEPALAEWRALCEREGFAPPPELARQVDEAREWHEGEQRKVDQTAEFETAVQTLATAVDKSTRLDDLERLVYAVNKYNREIPTALRMRVERALADARLAASRQFRLKVGVIALLVIAVAVPVFLFARVIIVGRERRQWAGRIDAALAERDYEAARRLADELERRRPAIYGEPAFQDRVARIESEEKQFKIERRSFQTLMDRLDAIRAAGFPEEQPYADLEVQALKYAHADEEKIRLEEWLAARKVHEDERRQAAETKFLALTTAATQKFRDLATTDPEQEYDAYKALLAGVQRDLDAALAIQGVSKYVRSQLPALQRKAAVHAKSLERASARMTGRAALLDELKGALPRLERYEELLGKFIKEFQGDPELARIERTRSDCLLGIDLERGAEWGGPDEEAFEKQAKVFLALPESSRSVWRETLEWFSRRSEALVRLVDARRNLSILSENVRLYDLFSFTTLDPKTGDRRRYYYVGDVVTKAFGTGEAPQTQYTVGVFAAGHKQEERKFWTVNYELSLSDVPEENYAPHCKIVRKLLADLSDADPLACEGLLLRAAEALRADPDADPVPKVALLRMLLTQIGNVTFEHGALMERALKRLANVNVNVYWMDATPDAATLAAKDDMATLLRTLSEIPTAARSVTLRHRMHRLSLSRRPRCVGGVVAAGDGGVTLNLNGATSPEVWIVTRHKAGLVAVYIVARSGPDGALHILPEMKDKLYVGQPLFVPTDGRSTADVLSDVVKGVSPSGGSVLEGVTWPPNWPVNGRSADD